MTKEERDALRKSIESIGDRLNLSDVMLTAGETIDLLDTCDEFVREAAQQSATIELHIKTWHSNQREIELLRAAVRSAGDSVDSFGIDDPGTTAGRALDAIDLALGRPMSAARIWNGHLETCDDCNYGRDCTACAADGEHPPEHHACNCSVNGTGQKLRASADAETATGVTT